MSFIASHGGLPIGASLAALLEEVAAAARAPLEERPARVGAALGAHMLDARLLEGRDCPCHAERYVRHLLHADAEGGYAVVALAWRPGQMSPVHAHRTWCAFGVHRGVLTEGHYAPGENGSEPAQTGSILCPPGAVRHGAADPRLIHRLANLGSVPALSIHVYGVPFERFGEAVNLVYAA